MKAIKTVVFIVEEIILNKCSKSLFQSGSTPGAMTHGYKIWV
jgi:hypothetical protein